MLSLLEKRICRLQGVNDHVRQLHALLSELDFALKDARQIEKIIDQARRVADLPLDDLVLARARTTKLHFGRRQGRLMVW